MQSFSRSGRFIPLVLLFSVLSLYAGAQSLQVKGVLRNLLTEQGVDSTEVFLLRPDSTEVVGGLAEIEVSVVERKETWLRFGKNPMDGASFALDVPAPGRYLLRCRHEGFEESVTEVNIPNPERKKDYEVFLGDIYLQPLGTQLGEATVIGTRIKMFYNGDTLVYNAAAFVLPEGSLLGDLVEQLPGAELRDGNIYVNGRLIHNLLLSGKDFFNGNPQAALRNLPAYVVRRVKVFEQQDERSKTAETDLGDRQYVMDVLLKRRYIGTYLGHLTAAAGTTSRGEGGLFAMRFDERQSYSVSANANNLNRNVTYGRDYNQTSDEASGRRRRANTTLSYRFEPSGRVRFTADAEWSHRSSRLVTDETTEQFLPTGNLFGRSSANVHERGMDISGRTALTLRPRKGRYYEISYRGAHGHLDAQSSRRSFLSSVLRFDALSAAQALDSAFLLSSPEAAALGLLNRLHTTAASERLTTSHEANLTTHFSFLSTDLLYFKGRFSHENQSRDEFNLYRLQYPARPEASDFRRRYTPNRSRNYNYTLTAQYFRKYVNTKAHEARLVPKVEYSQDYRSDRSPLYRLDALGGAWGEGGDAPLQLLPSDAEALLTAIDGPSSPFYTTRTRRHTLGAEWAVDRMLRDSSWLSCSLEFYLNREESRLDYRRDGQYYPVRRNGWNPAPSLIFRYHPKAGDRYGAQSEWSLILSYFERLPWLHHLVPVADERDPLNVSLGNPDLKDARVYYTNLGYRRRLRRPGAHFSGSIYAYQTDRNVAWERVYDKESGVHTSRPVNINGNRRVVGNLKMVLPTDSTQRYVFTFGLYPTFEQSVDLSLTDDAIRSTRYKVNSYGVTPAVALMWRPSDRLSMNLDAKVRWFGVNGTRPDFLRICTTDLYVGLQVNATLPAKLQFTTGLNLVKRFGYTEAELCKARFRCDASLARTFGKFNLSLTAADLFASHRNVQLFLHSQGRTETLTNALPRYVLLSATWKFNGVAKKKK